MRHHGIWHSSKNNSTQKGIVSQHDPSTSEVYPPPRRWRVNPDVQGTGCWGDGDMEGTVRRVEKVRGYMV